MSSVSKEFYMEPCDQGSSAAAVVHEEESVRNSGYNRIPAHAAGGISTLLLAKRSGTLSQIESLKVNVQDSNDRFAEFTKCKINFSRSWCTLELGGKKSFPNDLEHAMKSVQKILTLGEDMYGPIQEISIANKYGRHAAELRSERSHMRSRLLTQLSPKPVCTKEETDQYTQVVHEFLMLGRELIDETGWGYLTKPNIIEVLEDFKAFQVRADKFARPPSQQQVHPTSQLQQLSLG